MRIGELFHVVHVVDDLPAAEAWYDAVFAPSYMFRRHRSDLDHRIASLMLVADLPIEPMSPFDTPKGRVGTIGRFQARFGPRLHSLAFYTDSVGEAYERFRALGVRVNGDGGAPLHDTPERGGIYTHPRDTFGLIELMEPRVAGRGGAPIGDSLGECYDPRLLGTHDAGWWEREHALGVRRIAYLTVMVDDLDRAIDIYCAGLDADVVAESSAPSSVFVLVGQSTVVRLMAPDPGGVESAALASEGSMIWSVTLQVNDLDRAVDHLRSTGTKTTRADGLVTIDPADAFAARFALIDAPIDGDPRSFDRQG